MKVPVWIEYSEEKMVDVTLADIASAIAEDPDSTENILRGINNCAKFLKAIPDFEIGKLTGEQRGLIHNYLIGQAERYKINKLPVDKA